MPCFSKFQYHPPTFEFLKKLCLFFGLEFHQYVFGNANSCSDIKGMDIVRAYFNNGNGNCGFYTISWLVSGTEKNHIKIRKLIYEEILRNPDPYYDTYRDAAAIKLKMNWEGGCSEEFWMQEIDLSVAAHLFGMNIYSFHPKLQRKWILHNTISYKKGYGNAVPIFGYSMLLRIHNGHAEAVVNVKEDPNFASLWQILWTIGSSSATTERCFSSLKFFKNEFRNATDDACVDSSIFNIF